MDYQVLIPTHHKSTVECFELAKKLNIYTNCLISNQNGDSNIIKKELVEILNVNSIGVSKNRNSLLKNCHGEICICIDDDCPLVKNYVDIIENEFTKFPNAEFILFNGIVTHENNRLVHNKKSKKVRRFKDISYGGGPGLVFKKSALAKYKLSYNENIGYPNKIQLGEDTLFLKSLIDQKAKVVRSKEVLFVIQDDVDNSIYFKGVSEEFVYSRGYVTWMLHHHLWRLYIIKYSFFLKKWRNNKFSLLKLHSLLKKGALDSKKAENH